MIIISGGDVYIDGVTETQVVADDGTLTTTKRMDMVARARRSRYRCEECSTRFTHYGEEHPIHATRIVDPVLAARFAAALAEGEAEGAF